MLDTRSRIPTDEAERLALGKKLHEKEWGTIAQAANALGMREHQLYPIQKEYRDSVGIVTPAMLNATRPRAPRVEAKDEAQARRNEVKRRSYLKRKAEKEAAKLAANAARHNGGNGQLVRIPAAQNVELYQNRIAELETAKASLEDQLAHALDECHTLQKLLMVVGRTL